MENDKEATKELHLEASMPKLIEEVITEFKKVPTNWISKRQGGRILFFK
jgi:hypothetical protein